MEQPKSSAVPPEKKIAPRIILPERANEPYSDSEVELILSKVPTLHNVALLARSLKRTRAAITTVYQMAYSGKWLKQALETDVGHIGQNDVHLKIADVKNRIGIVIGHQPKARALDTNDINADGMKTDEGGIMAFNQDKARIKNILQAHKAPNEVIVYFDDLCRTRTEGKCKDKAEDLLRDVCFKYGFVAPYMRDGESIFFRPYNLDDKLPGYQSDCMGTDPATEQGYRRGYDQGVAHVLQMLDAGRSVKEIKAYSEQAHRWRLQRIQAFHSLPGSDLTQDLPQNVKNTKLASVDHE